MNRDNLLKSLYMPNQTLVHPIYATAKTRPLNQTLVALDAIHVFAHKSNICLLYGIHFYLLFGALRSKEHLTSC